MPGNPRPVGWRPRWPDVVIACAFLVLVGVGVAALFGPAIRAWLGGEPPPATAAPQPAAGAPI